MGNYNQSSHIHKYIVQEYRMGMNYFGLWFLKVEKKSINSLTINKWNPNYMDITIILY